MDVLIHWDLDDDPHGNVQHIAEHGLTKEDVEHAVGEASGFGSSRGSTSLILFGCAVDGRPIAVVFEFADVDEIYPLTAFLVDDR